MIRRAPIRAEYVSPELGDVVLFDHDPRPALTLISVAACLLGTAAALGSLLWITHRTGTRGP